MESDNGQGAYAIALGVACAFDRAWHRGIISELRSFGICGNSWTSFKIISMKIAFRGGEQPRLR